LLARAGEISPEVKTRRLPQEKDRGGVGAPTGRRPVALAHRAGHGGRTGLEPEKCEGRTEREELIFTPSQEAKLKTIFQSELILSQGGTLPGAAAGQARAGHRLDGARSSQALSHVRQDIMGSPTLR